MAGRLRITGGQLGRRLIAVPKAADRGEVRPTSDRVREAIFSALASRAVLEGAHVADIFAGSGALGLEALSRGAAHCTFVERDRATAKTLRDNIAALGVQDRSTVLGQDARAALLGAKTKWAFVFADPPYALELDAEWMDALAHNLVAGGLLLVERDKKSAPLPAPAACECIFDRAWGQSRVFGFERRAME